MACGLQQIISRASRVWIRQRKSEEESRCWKCFALRGTANHRTVCFAVCVIFATVMNGGIISKQIAEMALDKLRSTILGLDNMSTIERRYLKGIIERWGGPVGLEALVKQHRRKTVTLEECVITVSSAIGFINRTPRTCCNKKVLSPSRL